LAGDRPVSGMVVVVVVARGAAIAAAVVSWVMDEDVVSQSVRANFPCSLPRGSGTRNCGKGRPTRREIASERTWQQMRVAQYRQKKSQN
jgi:hypothetical protein